MAQERKVLQEVFEDSRILPKKSGAVENLLLDRQAKNVDPKEELDGGWKLETTEIKKTYSYDDVSGEQPGNKLHKAAKELSVCIEAIYTYVKQKNAGGGFSKVDADNESDLEEAHLFNEMAEIFESDLEENTHISSASFLEFFQNTPDAIQAQHYLLPFAARLPSVSHQIPFICALKELAPANTAFVSEAAEHFQLLSFDADIPSSQQSLARIAQHQIADPALSQDIAYALQSLPAYQPKIQQPPAIEQTLQQHALPSGAVPMSEVFAQFSNNETMMEKIEAPAFQQPAQMKNLSNDPFSLNIPNAPAPTASFYADLGITSGGGDSGGSSGGTGGAV